MSIEALRTSTLDWSPLRETEGAEKNQSSSSEQGVSQPPASIAPYNPLLAERFFTEALSAAEAGQFDRSLQLAQTHLIGYELQKALSFLCKAKAKAGQADEAFEIVERAAPEGLKQALLSSISRGLAEKGEAEKSTEVAYMIFDELDRDLTLEHNAKELVKLGARDQALEVANKISNRHAKRRALTPIASAFREAGEAAKVEMLQPIIDSLPLYREIFDELQLGYFPL